MKRILLIGGGPHATCCIDIIEKEAKYAIVGILDSVKKEGTDVMGYKILGSPDILPQIIKEYNIEAGFVSIGDNWNRKIVKDKCLQMVPDFEFISAIHPSSIIARNVTIGYGTVIVAGSVINPNAIIGNFCYLGSGTILEHNSIMEDYSSLSIGSVTGGFVKIGEFSAVTVGVILFDRISIGKHTVIGSGSLVTKDIPSNVLAYGSPARVIRTREIGEKYLK
jgi:sugar O-acyltransferase (sialic acid O-acetyltransferase NeuD family)